MTPASPQAAGGHIVYATRDLNLGIDKLEEAFGDLSVQAGPQPALIAEVTCPHGRVELR